MFLEVVIDALNPLFLNFSQLGDQLSPFLLRMLDHFLFVFGQVKQGKLRLRFVEEECLVAVKVVVGFDGDWAATLSVMGVIVLGGDADSAAIRPQ